MKKLTLTIISVFFCLSFISQVTTVNNSSSVSHYIQNVLVGNGVSVSNIQHNGATANFPRENVGSFNNPSMSLGISSGIILGTGNVQLAAQPNTSGNGSLGGGTGAGSDTDLQSISTAGIRDECVVEFDFVPQGDTIKFNYVFASEEYEEFVCASFNDVFGFFLTGPNPAGGNYSSTNLALIPNPSNPSTYTTTPVSINTVNPGVPGGSYSGTNCSNIDPNWASYNVFYTPNTTNDYEYDGKTVVLEVKAAVVCNQTYHIKLAIGDASDGSYDSGVFIEAGSFSSEAIDINVSATSVANTMIGDSAILEGCIDATFSFIRPDTIGDLTLDIDVLGSATNGVDYNHIPDSIFFPEGTDTATINISTIADGISEGVEDITINIYTITPCGDTLVTSGTLYIVEDYDYNVSGFGDTTYVCPIDSTRLTALASGGIAPYTYQWDNGDSGDTIYASPTQTTNYIVTAYDACNIASITDTVTVSFNLPQQLQANMNDTALCNSGFILINANTTGGAEPISFSWSSGSTSETTLVSPTTNTTYFVTMTDTCGITVVDSVTVTVDITPVSVSFVAPDYHCIGDDLILTPIISGGTPPYSYNWNINGQLSVNNQTGSATVTNPTSGDFSLSLTDGCNQQSNYSKFIDVIGCSITIPNVITPNDDNKNETFVISNLEYHPNTKIKIYNRWGRMVYSSDNYKNDWKGENVSAGTYYYVLELKDDKKCDEIDCTGFITIIK